MQEGLEDRRAPGPVLGVGHRGVLRPHLPAVLVEAALGGGEDPQIRVVEGRGQTRRAREVVLLRREHERGDALDVVRRQAEGPQVACRECRALGLVRSGRRRRQVDGVVEPGRHAPERRVAAPDLPSASSSSSASTISSRCRSLW